MNGEELSKMMKKEISDRLFEIDTTKNGWHVMSETESYKIKAFYWKGKLSNEDCVLIPKLHTVHVNCEIKI